MSSLFYLLSFQSTQVYLCAPDQAVKTLTETWHPDDIPTVFTASGREALCAQPEPSNSHAGCSASPPLISTGFSALFAGDNAQLPSPVTPTSHQTPLPTGDRCESYSQAPEGSVGSNLIPIKGFVHEVLRRSRTSTGVLQTALCYLEAVRSKVPELLRKEKTRPASESATFEEPPEPRIVQGVFEDEVFTSASSGTPDKTAGPTLETIRIGDTVLVGDIGTDGPLRHSGSAARGQDESALPPLPLLPSPLCCPRRTFLACLILASKFMQDRSYSNRAWAKLAGLPPREIGRCERALGEALEWRLWVGKLPASSAATSGANVGRTVSRTRSEGDVLYGSRTCTPSSTAAWATTSAAPVASSSAHIFLSIPPPIPAPRIGMRGLSRSATVPAIGADRSSTLVDPFFVPTSDATGYYYEAREAPRSGYDNSSQMDVEPQYEISPSLSTPTLSYSPMSSASSSSDGSEDRTIQMSMFLDLPTPAMSTGTNLGPWVANISSYTPSDPANPCGSFSSIPAYSYLNPANPTYAADMDVTEAAARSTFPTFDLSGVKQLPNALPSFAEMFSNPGAFDNGTQ
ncbi:hypothetical protein BD311DRAFT_651534 [Dichomitus squalens]|uniref:Cyclin N-terminal domain-containing protein n=1 Tax=Dichomitus squalens TaxID=114155 RepID=A0A4Q9N078_9APHY|nr:hypothetical protein BD311DRAFT_651534 [Dichomitus squalens]